MAVSIKARIIFPVDRPPIENGVVTIDGNRIVEVGTSAAADEVIDLGSTALLPGLVNAHTHLEFSYLEQPLGQPGMSLPEWIRLVIAERGRDDKSQDEALTWGLIESQSCGVTTIGNITTSLDDIPAKLLHSIYYIHPVIERIADTWTGADQFSLRLIDATYFQEVIGFSRARAESALNALIASRDEFGPRDPAVRVAKSRRTKRVGISPHAPYTVSPQLLEKLIALARRNGMPMAMHLAESREERELLREGTGPFQALLEERSMWDAEAIPRGSRPLDYLRLLADAPRTLVIHGNYLDEEELTFLAANRARMSLVYCPRTHAYFGHDAYPLAKAVAAGVRVALGTDSRASNPDLDLLAEMRYVARAHSTFDPHDALRMGTLAGAEALGRENEVGSLTAGKVANMIAVPLAEDAGGPDAALESLLASDARVSAVWVRGTRCKLGVPDLGGRSDHAQ